MEEPLKICSALLLELVSRWSLENKSFRIREHLVSFNVFDVCVVLGFLLGDNKFVLIRVQLGWLTICLVMRK